MEVKQCELCEFFGTRKHCGNCAINKNSFSRAYQKIEMPIEELCNMINNTSGSELRDILIPGDYIELTTDVGYPLTIKLLDIEHDYCADGTVAKTTWGVMNFKHLTFSVNVDISHSPIPNATYKENNRDEYIVPSGLFSAANLMFSILPQSLQCGIKPVSKLYWFPDQILTIPSKLFIPSNEEVFGSQRYDLFWKEPVSSQPSRDICNDVYLGFSHKTLSNQMTSNHCTYPLLFMFCI